jgi:hypothetical protein
LYGKKVNTIQNEIVRLRHACDHFQLGEQGLRLVGNEGRKTHIVKETLTLDDLQDSLVQQELNRYTALVRKVLRGKAHCAGVLMLSNEFERAVVLYDEVLTFGLNEKDCKVDSTILIHSAHNLLEAVKLAGRHAPKVNVDVAKKMLGRVSFFFSQRVLFLGLMHSRQRAWRLLFWIKLDRMLEKASMLCKLFVPTLTVSSTDLGGKTR